MRKSFFSAKPDASKMPSRGETKTSFSGLLRGEMAPARKVCNFGGPYIKLRGAMILKPEHIEDRPGNRTVGGAAMHRCQSIGTGSPVQHGQSGTKVPHSKRYRAVWAFFFIFGSILACRSSLQAQIQQAWVAKYNNGITNGNHQAMKMTLDSAGNIYVLGVSANSNTNTGYVVVKYASNGNQTWVARYDSTNYPFASPTGFAMDSSNNIVVTGNAVTVKYDIAGNPLWTASYSAQAIALDAGQNVYITGVGSKFTTMKLNQSGSNLWTMTWTYEGLANISQAIAVDASSNVYVAGDETVNIPPENRADIGFLKYDYNGNQIWVNNISLGTSSLLK
jgi:hypothetical protein